MGAGGGIPSSREPRVGPEVVDLVSRSAGPPSTHCLAKVKYDCDHGSGDSLCTRFYDIQENRNLHFHLSELVKAVNTDLFKGGKCV